MTNVISWKECRDGYFNSHPHEEDDQRNKLIIGIKIYFNSHPHEEDDEETKLCRMLLFISTHILTKRMTKITIRTRLVWSFQLTSSRRGWPKADTTRVRRINISTHILTKRMTLYWVAMRRIISQFQLTSSRRGWRHTFLGWSLSNTFQLTSSRRGWRC